jgi:hypothetical protein
LGNLGEKISHRLIPRAPGEIGEAGRWGFDPGSDAFSEKAGLTDWEKPCSIGTYLAEDRNIRGEHRQTSAQSLDDGQAETLNLRGCDKGNRSLVSGGEVAVTSVVDNMEPAPQLGARVHRAD